MKPNTSRFLRSRLLIPACISLALANASCSKTPSDAAGDKPLGPTVQPNAPSPKPSSSPGQTGTKQPNKDFVDSNYRAAASNWGKEVLFAGMDDSRAFARAKTIDMHYAYLAFAEVYPDSSNKTECVSAMKQFSCADTPATKTTLSFAELAKTFGFNGKKIVFHWNDGLVALTLPNGSFYAIDKSFNSPDLSIPAGGDAGTVLAPQGLCYGNLQLQNGGFEQVPNGLAFEDPTRIVYKLPAGK